MSSQTAMSLMDVTEFVLWAVLAFLFWRKKQRLRFPTMAKYLTLQVAATPVLLFLDYGQSRHWLHGHFFDMFFVAYYAVYLASAVMIYFICVEVFRSALATFTGLMRLGTIAFRWAALVSVIVAVSSITFTHIGGHAIIDISHRLMRSVSILELCLLGFLCLSMNALRIPMRGMAFGISLGFGIMASSGFILGSFATRHTTDSDLLQLLCEGMTLVAISSWGVWCALPEPELKPVVIPANSIIHRWNEIACALGHTGTKVAVQPASGFFLSDVERVVEKVLTRNLKDRESES